MLHCIRKERYTTKNLQIATSPLFHNVKTHPYRICNHSNHNQNINIYINIVPIEYMFYHMPYSQLLFME